MKAYLDVDPGFTQLWVEVCNSDMNLEGHDVFLTVGTTMNWPEASLPMLGREWLPFSRLLWPIIGAEKLGAVPVVTTDGPWTTIGHWYGYPELEWQGRRYAGKRESLIKMRSLPKELLRPCAIATDLCARLG